jgi:hypothetical protein
LNGSWWKIAVWLIEGVKKNFKIEMWAMGRLYVTTIPHPNRKKAKII